MQSVKPLITFLIPTRKRLGMLKASIESLESTCSKFNSFEVIAIFDEDDIDTIEGMKALKFQCTVKIVISKRHGYYGLHQYINNAYEHGSGSWFWLWNDDLTMVSTGWDDVVRGYKDRFVILNSSNINPDWSDYCKDATISPLVPRRWFELLKRFSAYSQYDTYVNSIAYRLNIVINEPRLINNHEQVHDEVSDGISYDVSQFPAVDSEYDYLLLCQYLGKKNLFINWLERSPYRLERALRRKKRHFKRMFSQGYLHSRLNWKNVSKKIFKAFQSKTPKE